MSAPKSDPETPVEFDEQEQETRLTLAEAGNVIRPQLETGSYILGLAVLLITCALLVPLIQDPLLIAVFGIGMLVIVVGGGYFLVVQRPRAERKRMELRQTVLEKLDQCAEHIDRLRACMREAPTPDARKRLERICERADKLVATLGVNEQVKLETATAFETALDEMNKSVCAYVGTLKGDALVAGDGAQTAQAQIGAIEQALDQFASQLQAGNLAAFDASVNALTNNLRSGRAP